MTDPTWNEPDPTILDELTQHGCFAADQAVLDGTSRTPAEHVRVAVRAALRMLLANGVITATPQTEWPEWWTSEPAACERCGSTEDVSLGPDPFKQEIDEDLTPVWMCARCREERADDV